jgi:hypothetical protein
MEPGKDMVLSAGVLAWQDHSHASTGAPRLVVDQRVVTDPNTWHIRYGVVSSWWELTNGYSQVT